MHDQASASPLTSIVACPRCEEPMLFIAATPVASAGIVDRFDCTHCGVTRLRPRRPTGGSYFDLLSSLDPRRPARAALRTRRVAVLPSR